MICDENTNKSCFIWNLCNLITFIIWNLILQRVLRCTYIPQGQIEGMHNTRWPNYMRIFSFNNRSYSLYNRCIIGNNLDNMSMPNLTNDLYKQVRNEVLVFVLFGTINGFDKKWSFLWCSHKIDKWPFLCICPPITYYA